MASRHSSIARTLRILGTSSVFLALSACSANTGSTTGQSASALTNTSADGGTIDPTACLTTYVECVRGDAGSCRQALHDCMRPGGDHGEHGGRGGPGCDGGAPPPRPDDGDADDGVDGGAPTSGPGACIAALDQCAASAETVDACVGAADTCFAALPPPPAGGRGHRH